MEWTEALTLYDYVNKLITEGKRSKDPEFQVLFRIFGKAKITEMAIRAINEGKGKKNDPK